MLAVAALALVADRLVQVVVGVLPPCKLHSLQAIIYHMRSTISGDDVKFLQQLHPAQSLLRHVPLCELQARIADPSVARTKDTELDVPLGIWDPLLCDPWLAARRLALAKDSQRKAVCEVWRCGINTGLGRSIQVWRAHRALRAVSEVAGEALRGAARWL